MGAGTVSGWRDAYGAGYAAGRRPGALLPELRPWDQSPLNRAARQAGFEAGRIERGIGCYPVRLADLTGRHGNQFWAVAPGLFQATKAGEAPAMNGAGYPDLESIWKAKGCGYAAPGSHDNRGESLWRNS